MVSVQESAERTPPLMSFSTLVTALDALKTKGVPKKIDRSVFKTMAFTVQAQIVTTLKYFDLIDSDGQVAPALRKLVMEPDDRPAAIKALLESRYPKLVELGASGATEQQLVEAVREMGLKGEDPIRKAIAFYRKAAEFSDVPISSYWQSKPGPRTSANGGARRPRKPRGTKIREEKRVETEIKKPLGSADVPIHPMLAGAIQYMWEKGDSWAVVEREMWCRNFVNSVEMIYPGGAKPRLASSESKRTTSGRKSATEDAPTVEPDDLPIE